MRALGFALAKHANVSDADLEDFAQDALLKILANLGTFRGESRFTTWAQKIAVHVAFTELRRRRWTDVSLADLMPSPDSDFVPLMLIDATVRPEQQAVQREVLITIERVLREGLTDRQREALVASKVHGMPVVELAHRMGTNPNALHKLIHDARRRLKKELLARGLSPRDALAAFET